MAKSKQRGPNMNRIASLSLAFAGIIHLVLAPQHFSHAPAHGIFFAVAGVAQIIWAYAFWRKPTERLYYVGLGLAGGLVVLWVMTRLLPAPFHHHPEAVDFGGIACKISELVSFGALLALAAQGSIVGLRKQTTLRLLGVAVVLSVVAGGVTYVAAKAAEPLFPSLNAAGHEDDGEHQEEDDHGHEGEGHAE
jgi:hypothetical protein